jgi:surface-anchored protein
LRAHDEFTDDLYDADEVLFYVSKADRKTMPDDPDFAFIGANPGHKIWVLPQVFDPSRLSVGVSAEDIADGTFDSYYESDSRVHATGPWVKLSFVEIRGPGEVSLWQNDGFGRPVVWMATTNGFTDDNAVFIYSGRDSDFNWAFTARGIYEIDVVASAYLPGDDLPIYSDVVTYTFGVQSTEP